MNRFLPRVCLVLAISALAGCGAKTTESTIDGQSHWLTACETDATCGTASCLCGVCTSECEEDSDCWVQGNMASRCAAAEPLGCNAAPRVCVPDCPGDGCISSEETSTESSNLSSRLVFDSHEVPRCPEVADRVGLPLVSVIADVEAYDGPATVDSIENGGFGTRIVLVLNELVGGQVTLNAQTEAPFTQGSRYQAHIESRGNREEYAFIALRDDTGTLILAANSGRDDAYQAGRFATTDAFGATFEMRMKCQSGVDDGCFENQVQAEYIGTFTADNQVSTDGGTYETLSIDGRPYTVSFVGSSIDGGEPLCDSGITPGRSIHFAVLAE